MQHPTAPFGEISGKHDQLLQWLMQAENSLPEITYRTVGMEDYRFYAGKQDDPAAVAILEDGKRPATVYNEIKPKVDMLIGRAAQARNEIKLVPVGSEDESLEELLTGVHKHFRKKTNLNRTELDAFEHTAKSGRSMIYFYIDKSNPFKPAIKCKRLEGWQFYIDPNSREYDLSDARYVFMDKWVSAADIEAFWPGTNVTMLDSYGGRAADYPEYFNQDAELYRLVEAWWTEFVEGYWFINPLTGDSEFLKQKEFNVFKDSLSKGIDVDNGRVIKTDELQYKKGIKKAFMQSIFAGFTEIERSESPYYMERYPMVFFGAYRDDDFNNWFGAITMMKDPQRAINTMRRQLSHLLQTLPKGILQHEVGAVLNIEEYETRSSEPGYHMELAKGAMEKVKFVQQPQIPNIYERFDEINVQGMKDVSGVQDPMLGIQTSSREAGVTMRIRQETSVAVLFMLYRNYEDSRHQCARVLMSLVQQYVTQQEVFRIEGDQGKRLIQINSQLNPQVKGWNDITAMEYDLDTTDATDMATSRLATGQILADYSQNNPGAIPPDVMLDYADVPYSVKQRVRGMYEMQQQAAMQEQQHAQVMAEQDAFTRQLEMQIKLKELSLKERELELKVIEINSRNDLETKKLDATAKIARQKQLSSNSSTKQSGNSSSKKK